LAPGAGRALIGFESLDITSARRRGWPKSNVEQRDSDTRARRRCATIALRIAGDRMARI